MRRLLWVLVLGSATLWACGGGARTADPVAGTSQAGATVAAAPRAQPTGSAYVYPASRRGDVVDNYHGTEVADPYRWLEDTDAPDTKAWVEAQNKVTFAFLDKIESRSKLRERLTRLWDYEKFGVPRKIGKRYFFSRNDGLQNQSVMYWTPSLSEEPKVLLDPNTWSEDGTVALGGSSVSDDGKYIAYGVARAGSDWAEWKVRNVDTGDDLDDHLKWVKFSGASWTKDGKGFFYSRYPEPEAGASLTGANFYQKLYYHSLRTTQDEDVLIHEEPEQKKWGFDGRVSEDGQYLIVSVWKGTGPKVQVLYRDLSKGVATSEESPMVALVGVFEAAYNFVGNEGTLFWFFTDLDAPRGRLIGIDIRSPDKESWKEILPQGKDTLRGVSLVGGRFIASYLQDAQSIIRVYDTTGKHLRDVDLPGIGTAGGFGGKNRHKETFYSFTSFTTPRAIYRYDVSTGKSELFRQPKVDFNPEDYEVKQVFYKSKDGTRVPMFITHKTGIELDGTNPTYLYGYGGFGISITPGFSVSRLSWLELGGVLAIPNLRGGGEYGEEWHIAGTKLNKQNVFDDFIAAAEWLIANKYTSTPRLAISGRSNGGLLVGAAMTQRPELFGAALPGVGVLDMLRFHQFTIGWAWVDDYGSSEDAEEFKSLFAYSPYHNVKAGTHYPATLITTADHDDRVVPGHSFKFAAALQATHAGKAPVMIRIETKAGHGSGKPTSMRIADAADQLAFLVEVLGVNESIE
ncbi:MAG: prolyl oligopeptidase family serine peptidase [Planctomycetota bacterium]|nr:prolyl oligopeptidase family serine peptidase [Planctomycetota bacterium]